MADPTKFQTALGEHADSEAVVGIENTAGLASKVVELTASNAEMVSAQPQVPESAEAYEFTAPEGATLNEEAMSAFKTVAHKTGLTAKQAQDLVNYDLQRSEESSKAAAEAAEQKSQEAIAAVKEKFGDGYDAAMVKANKVLVKFGPEDIVKDIDLGNDPVLFEFLVGVGKAISEDALETTPGAPSGEKKPLAERMFPDQKPG